MEKRQVLRPNQQKLKARSGRLPVSPSKAKSKEKPSIMGHATTGRGQGGESSSGGKGVKPIIRKGSTRASN
jgi:hypothetical protein